MDFIRWRTHSTRRTGEPRLKFGYSIASIHPYCIQQFHGSTNSTNQNINSITSTKIAVTSPQFESAALTSAKITIASS